MLLVVLILFLLIIIFSLGYTPDAIKNLSIESRIRLAKHYWFLSKNLNFYNPILESTVYRYCGHWSIARDGDYFGAFTSKKEAMDEAFRGWIERHDFTEIAHKLKDELEKLDHKVLNEHKYAIFKSRLDNARLWTEDEFGYNTRVIINVAKALVVMLFLFLFIS